MGYKDVCLNCRVAYNRKDYPVPFRTVKCRLCGQTMIFVTHAFRPPPKRDIKAWKVVEFLFSHGFYFQHIYAEGSNELFKKPENNYVPYPKTLEEAKEFVEKYKAYAKENPTHERQSTESS